MNFLVLLINWVVFYVGVLLLAVIAPFIVLVEQSQGKNDLEAELIHGSRWIWED